MLLDFVVFDYEVVDDELLAFGGVVAHVEGEEVADGIFFAEFDLVEAHVGSDEVLELVRRDFTETFEACDFGVGS